MSMTATLVFLGGLTLGTVTSLTTKMVYDVRSVDDHGLAAYFEKPFFMTFIMFVAMIPAFPLHYVQVAYAKQRDERNGDEITAAVPPNAFLRLLAPALFDLIATALASIGLLYITVSFYQLIKCVIIIFCAILKVVVLKQKLKAYMYVGIAINMVAMALVASRAFIDEPDATNARDPRVGILFVLASCLVQAGQYVYEEALMSDYDVPPLYVVGAEGIWGAFVMGAIVFPWAYIMPGTDYGSLENFLTAWQMVCNSSLLRWIILANMSAIFGYNIFCVYVTFLLNSIWHAILDNFRPIAVWSVDLLLYYYVTGHSFGEPWTKGSWGQLFGMFVLFLGTALYSGRLRLSWCDYSEDDMAGESTPLLTVDTKGRVDGGLYDSPRSNGRASSVDNALYLSSPLIAGSPIVQRGVHGTPKKLPALVLGNDKF